MSTNPVSTVFAVEITVHPAEHGPSLVPDQEYNFEVRYDDEIHMVRGLPDGESMTLLLTLSHAFGTTIRGLSFGRTSDEAQQGQVLLDTGGAYYEDSPFRVSPGPDGSAQLTVVNDPNAGRYRGERWFFDIWPQNATGIQRIDPQIYNKTPGGGTDSDDEGSPGYGTPREG